MLATADGSTKGSHPFKPAVQNRQREFHWLQEARAYDYPGLSELGL